MKSVLAPQCGLAPGYIGIVGAHLESKFEKVRSSCVLEHS